MKVSNQDLSALVRNQAQATLADPSFVNRQALERLRRLAVERKWVRLVARIFFATLAASRAAASSPAASSSADSPFRCASYGRRTYTSQTC